jgi:hypothetical protein
VLNSAHNFDQNDPRTPAEYTMKIAVSVTCSHGRSRDMRFSPELVIGLLIQ